MTRVYFVRHAQPDESCADDRTRPLTPLGLKDREKVTALLTPLPIDAFYSSPYKRSMDTVAGAAAAFGLPVRADERFRERGVGESGYDSVALERRWGDFDFAEPGGETLRSVQSRNIAALNDVLDTCRDQSVVIGTHGVALSAIITFYDPSFGCEGFRSIHYSMPYVVRLDFDGRTYRGREELLNVPSFY